MSLKPFQQEFARFLVETGSLFFRQGLVLKDGRPSPYFVNLGKFSTGKLSYRLGSFFCPFPDRIELAAGSRHYFRPLL